MPVQVPISPDSELGRLFAETGALLGAGRYAEAIPLLVRASEQHPDNPRIHVDLGALYIETGRYADAVAPLQRALAINPKIAIAHWQLGIALQMLGDAQGAIRALEWAAHIRPDLSDAHLRLALLYKQQGRGKEAAQRYRIAAQHAEPGEQQLLEAQALLEERREGEAEALLRSALEIDPDLPAAHGLLGQLLTVLGRFGEAAPHFEAEIARSPWTVLAYYDLARSRKMTESDGPLLQQIDTALGEQDFGDIDRSILLLARGKILDDFGRYEEAMRSLDEAAALHARAFSIEAGSFETKIDRIIALFDAETIASHANANPERKPVFIFGMPRSGTTLIEQIVSCHPDAAAGDELTFWTQRLDTALDNGRGGLTADFLKSAATDYLELLHTISSRAARVSDKQPYNFLAVGLIFLAFPQAALIHCTRNPVDTALSIHQTHFARSTGMPTGGEDLVRYFRAYQRLMAHWRRVLPEGRLFEMNYERLTASPPSEVRRLVDYIGLPWNPACLNPHASARLVRTASGWQVRQSINTGSVDRWRLYEPWLGPLAALREQPKAAG